jgi:hypothetical protein
VRLCPLVMRPQATNGRFVRDRNYVPIQSMSGMMLQILMCVYKLITLPGILYVVEQGGSY